MTLYDAVLFDFAGTLFDDRALRDAHLEQLRRLAELCEVRPTDDELRAAYRAGMVDAYVATADASYYSHRDLFAAAFAATATHLGGGLTDGDADDLVDRQYAATLACAPLRPGCHETLQALNWMGIHVQVVSNMDEDQFRPLLRRLKLTGLVHAATSSEEAQSCKPDPAIYDLALRKARTCPERALFVGDTVTHDVDGPRRAGMATALLARTGSDIDAPADFRVSALPDVVRLVSDQS